MWLTLLSRALESSIASSTSSAVHDYDAVATHDEHDDEDSCADLAGDLGPYNDIREKHGEQYIHEEAPEERLSLFDNDDEEGGTVSTEKSALSSSKASNVLDSAVHTKRWACTCCLVILGIVLVGTNFILSTTGSGSTTTTATIAEMEPDGAGTVDASNYENGENATFTLVLHPPENDGVISKTDDGDDDDWNPNDDDDDLNKTKESSFDMNPHDNNSTNTPDEVMLDINQVNQAKQQLPTQLPFPPSSQQQQQQLEEPSDADDNSYYDEGNDGNDNDEGNNDDDDDDDDEPQRQQDQGENIEIVTPRDYPLSQCPPSEIPDNDNKDVISCPTFDWEEYLNNATENPIQKDCDATLTNAFFGREPSSCQCRNPVKFWNRKRWDTKHQERIERAIKAQKAMLKEIQQQDRAVDIVFYGSSIVEQWMGAQYGVVTVQGRPKNRLFRTQFGPDQPLYGIILAMAADTTMSLLHHITIGRVLPDWLQPKIFWITIGTNDMAHFMCSENSVMLGTLAVVRELKRQRPNAKIVLNSMLPFGGNPLWQDPGNIVMRQVNRRRECFANVTDSVYFFNATDIFIDHRHNNATTSSSPPPIMINKARYLDDMVHPSLAGYRAWGCAISDFAHKILNE